MSYIGGSFEFNSGILSANEVGDANDQIGLSEDKVFWTKSGRSGFALVLKSWHKQLSSGWILMPDYQCWDVLSAFENIEKKFIPVNQELKLEISDLNFFLEDKNLRGIVLIDYFGLSNLNPYIQCIKSIRPDVLIIIDAVQAFLSIIQSVNRYTDADVVISSPRKFLPIPDGGLVIFNNKKPTLNLSKNSNTNEQTSYYLTAGTLKDAILKNSFDDEIFLNIESLYIELFEHHRGLFNNNVELISPLSMEIIKRTNLKDITKNRIANYKWMANSLGQDKYKNILSPIFNDVLGPGIVFPVRVDSKHRDPLRTYLKYKGIFCPVHWPIPKSHMHLLGKSSKILASEILGLPIDQRYHVDDLSRILKEINNYLKAHNL